MKASIKIGTAALLLSAGFWFGSVLTSNADGLISDNQPGSVNDPIVTKSYVDEQIQQKVKAELDKQTSGSYAGNSSSPALTVIPLKPGQILYAGAGTEFIVRTGKAVAFSTDGNGIPDLTAGKDIANGSPIEQNHLLLFPRDGGRGIKPDAKEKGTVYVMVRGKYMYVNADGTPVNP
ncbi:hypothetical protein [Ferviditalea candida]|uniref:Uncharacterized protein n=1 Tax=Ferviditalea candida TaxID=3108399 RepID=A0ABU5ZIJ4_9BACL|nr:hypothetical protein [Paenibacillaceae bacterium T2]